MKLTTGILRIYIDPASHEKLWTWVSMARGEISMLGLVEEVEDQPCIADLFLVKQTCTPASTDMDQEDIAKLMVELAGKDRSNQLRTWVHSHGDMDVFWSNQDDSTIEDLAGDPYLISVVVNKRGAVRARLDLFDPIRITVDDVPVEVLVPDMGLESECVKAFEDKVKEEPLAWSVPLGKSPENNLPWSFNHMKELDLIAHHNDMAPCSHTPQELEEMARGGKISYEEYLTGVEEWSECEDEQGGLHGEETTE